MQNHFISNFNGYSADKDMAAGQSLMKSPTEVEEPNIFKD